MQALPAAKRYRQVAPLYDGLAALYSGGQIRRLKEHQAKKLGAGWRVLYAGAGTGQELPAALERSAQLTLLDQSPEMLSLARKQRGADSVSFVTDDIFAHRPDVPYDAVVANFFLNVFSPREVERLFDHLAQVLGPGGRLLVGDFAPPAKNPLWRSLQWAYYMVPLVFFWLVTGNAFHGLPDFRKPAKARGFILEDYQLMRIFGFGPRWLCRMTFRKKSEESEVPRS